MMNYEPRDNNNTSRHNPDDDDLDDAIGQARQELQALQTRRQDEQLEYQQELAQVLSRWKSVQRLYTDKLKSSPHHHASRYMSFLTQPQRNNKTTQNDNHHLPPLYVLNQQTTLLLVLYSNFVLLPHQTQLLEQQAKPLQKYLQQQIDQLDRKAHKSTHVQLLKVSQVAEQNTVLYDNYQQQVDRQEQEIRELLALLPKHEQQQQQQQQQKNQTPTVVGDDSDSDDDHSISSHNDNSEEAEATTTTQEDDDIGKIITDKVVNIFRMVHMAV